jgi:proteasome accessory factor B
MAGEERMEPLERLLNLVGLLLEARTPLTFDEIRDTLEAYRSDKHDTAKRMFERDKDILREYGVPLELVDTDAWGVEQGYVIDKAKYYLPEIAFTDEELAALFVAAQGGGEDRAAEQGVRKLLYGADGGVLVGFAGGPLASGSDAPGALVLAAAQAAQTRRHVRFGYRTSEGRTGERHVDAFAMVFRGGRWYLVGRDHDRDDVRAFRLSRFTDDLVVEGDGIEPPEGFRAADHVRPGPWTPAADDRAIVAFDPDAAWLALGSLAGAVWLREREDGRIELEVPFADAGAAAGLLLQFGPDVEVLAPPSLRAEVIARLEALARA